MAQEAGPNGTSSRARVASRMHVQATGASSTCRVLCSLTTWIG